MKRRGYNVFNVLVILVAILAGRAAGSITVALNGTTISSDSTLSLQTNGTTTALSIDAAQNVTLTHPMPAGSGGTGTTTFGRNLFYGDGSDSTLTYDGSTTVLGVAPVGSVYTLTRSIYPSNMTVNATVTVKTAGHVILCTSALTNNGTIHCNGGDASGSTGGAQSNSTATFGANNASGSNGSTTLLSSAVGANALAATSTTLGGGGGGGGGGRSDGTNQNNGTSASLSNKDTFDVRIGFPASIAGQATLGSVSYGGNGGQGSGDGTNAGGGSGASGGCVLIRARTITTGSAGVYSANGGAGGSGAAGTAGGGGGGGGGGVYLYSESYTGTALVSGTNVTANGGAHGTGQGGAGNGQNGLPGQVFIFTVPN